MNSTHVLIFKPISKYRKNDLNRSPIIYHSSQVLSLYRFNQSWCLIDFKGNRHYIPLKSFELSIGIVNRDYLHQ